ncbi:phage head spike fiber domain-containing protein [Ferrovibrio sp.]|uniref:phage head spike fiber domain-containing protein n=1 Tax=Ferrovibrio sp. TaxID=1917215 RepID=UPI003D11C81B
MIYPSLNLDARLYLNDSGGKPSIATVTRASAATCFDAVGKLVSVSSGVLRHDFDPVTGTYLGWLIEEARTNLLLRSEAIDNASWTKLNATVPVTNVLAPDGASTADELREDSATGVHLAYQAAAGTASNPYTLTAFAKATASPRRFLLDLDDGSGNGVRALFDPGAGSVSGVTGTGSGTGATGSIAPIGAGWYRCRISGTPNSGGGATVRGLVRLVNGGGADNYAGDNASGVYLWGLQLEAGAIPTSYIATAGSQVTRAADLLTVATSAFAYNQAEGTLLVRFDAPATAVVPAVLYADNNNFAAFDITSPYKARGVVTAGGSGVATLADGVFAAGVQTAAALAYKLNDFALSVNGATPVTDGAGAVPSAASALHIGAFNGASIINGHIRHIAYFPRRLVNAELQDISR